MTSFWDAHVYDTLILFGCVFFPRITMLAMGGVDLAFATVLHGFGWFLTPHIMVAVLATMTYWDTNPALVIFSWFFAFTGTGTEGTTVKVKVSHI